MHTDIATIITEQFPALKLLRATQIGDCSIVMLCERKDPLAIHVGMFVEMRNIRGNADLQDMLADEFYVVNSDTDWSYYVTPDDSMRDVDTVTAEFITYAAIHLSQCIGVAQAFVNVAHELITTAKENAPV